MDSWNSHAPTVYLSFNAASGAGRITHACVLCGKRYVSIRNLNRHLRRGHGQQVDEGTVATAATSSGTSAGSGTAANIGTRNRGRKRLRESRDIGGGLQESTPPTYAQLVNSESFFINRRGRYQFNTNEDRRHVNCPFCILHRTSLHGLAKHCSAKHKIEYQDWRSGHYGRVQLRRVPASDAALRTAMELLLEAGLLDPAVPLESVGEAEAAAAPTPEAAAAAEGAVVIKKRRLQLRKDNSHIFRGEEAQVHVGGGINRMGTGMRPPRLPPCPPLVDCRGLVAARQDGTPQHDAVQRQQRQQLDQPPPYHQGGDPILQYMYGTQEVNQSRAYSSCDPSIFAQASAARHMYRNHQEHYLQEHHQPYRHVPRSSYHLSVPPGASYNNPDYVQQQRQQQHHHQSEMTFPGHSFYDGPACFDGYPNNNGPYY